MKKIKRITAGTLALLCLLTSVLFAGNLMGAGTATEPDPPQTGTAAPETPEPPEPPDRPEPVPEQPAEEPSSQEPGEAEAPVMATAHFALEEYRCDCGGYCDGWPCEMEPELLEKIETLRCVFGRPVIITSGVRCEVRNTEVGGVAWSFHMRGCAADLYCPGVAVGELAEAAKDIGLNVLPYYAHGYIHVEI
ncbi:D-Ala-D-Ala carboxypeptidase family metallohydrolase [Eubacterium sp. 1001713B170207_170306_E7]|uniref:YcbK family protein n=1 Tax=Eubacterium sp. 1001713B170207_170306_E7 TaxID=2787097 RepID=UPI0018992D02|nr:D-Ala-D-Ala carboxypeptidase family metallohydrolase [Eubacterium sp. 1001713B170207_170306_E7]